MTHIKSIEEYHVGDRAEVRHTITIEDVQAFADLTGDYNPLHLNADFAKETSFKKPVVYGMLSASFISTLIGMKIPGPGALWTSQTLQFLKQVFVGDTLLVEAVVKQISTAAHTMVLQIAAYNQEKQPVLEGEATVQLLEVAQAEEKESEGTKSKRVCLVTGGSSDIGGEIAKKLLQDGYAVALQYGKSSSRAQLLYNNLCDQGELQIYQADLRDMEQVREMIEKIRRELGDVTDLVHCAAPHNTPQSFLDMEWSCFETQFHVQVKGFFHCMKALLPRILEGNVAGRVVCIASIAADDVPPANQCDYVMAKAALSAVVKSLAVEYGPKGIAFSMVAPGMTETSRIADLPQKAKLLTKMQSPSRSLVQPEEVARAVCFLLEQETCVMTGETLRVCGGIHMI